MMQLAIALFSIAFVLLAFGMFRKRRTEQTRMELVADDRPIVATERPRPKLVEFHIRGLEAHVWFDVPLGSDGADDILSEFLVAEAVEVTREKQHRLPIGDVTHVVALAGRGVEPLEAGRMELPARGKLPPPMEAAPSLSIGHLGFDPMEKQFESGNDVIRPEAVSSLRSDDLGPIGDELRLPKVVEFGLRGQGVDPSSMSSGELVRGILTVFGYQLETVGIDAYIANKAGARTYVLEVPHEDGDHPELDESVAKKFIFEFLQAKADRGMLVSDKFSPYVVYEMERNERRIQFITRERLQNFVDSAALS
jgi:hypothetical protein